LNLFNFSSKEIAAIAVFSALWGILNAIFSPIFFRATGMPFLCDVIGFAVLALAGWWIRKFGVITIIGLIATAITLIISPAQIQFLGFIGAAFVFDVLLRGAGYNICLKNNFHITLSILAFSIISAAVAGLSIGSFFMPTVALVKWGGVLGWAGLHAIGGIIGGIIGVFLVIGLISRKINQ